MYCYICAFLRICLITDLESFSRHQNMGCTNKTNIYTITEKSSEMTLFDCRWVPSSARFIVAGTHTKGHGILTVYAITESEELKQSG